MIYILNFEIEKKLIAQMFNLNDNINTNLFA